MISLPRGEIDAFKRMFLCSYFDRFCISPVILELHRAGWFLFVLVEFTLARRSTECALDHPFETAVLNIVLRPNEMLEWPTVVVFGERLLDGMATIIKEHPSKPVVFIFVDIQFCR